MVAAYAGTGQQRCHSIGGARDAVHPEQVEAPEGATDPGDDLGTAAEFLQHRS